MVIGTEYGGARVLKRGCGGRARPCAAYDQLQSLDITGRETRGVKKQKKRRMVFKLLENGDLDTGAELPINAFLS